VYRRVFTLSLCSLLAACGGKADRHVEVAAAPEEVVPVWRRTITPQDSLKLGGLPMRWAALHERLPARVRKSRGRVVDPKAGLDHPTLSPGSYRCRVLRLRGATRSASVRSSAPGFCYVSAAEEGFAFIKQTGSDPAAGYFYPDGDRYVFLGARQRRAGENSLGYSADPARDMVGVVERVGGFRWRLAVPDADGNQVQIYELTPVPADQQPRG